MAGRPLNLTPGSAATKCDLLRRGNWQRVVEETQNRSGFRIQTRKISCDKCLGETAIRRHLKIKGRRTEIEEAVQAAILASIEAGRLVIICGAGLSMAPPSSLPSSVRVANVCYDKHTLSTGLRLDPNLRNDLEALANHFAEQNTLVSIFIDRLVPWNEWNESVRPPNPGHSAIADFLICKAVAAALSSNFDFLIEYRARGYGADLLGSLDGDEANLCTEHAPLLKFHGCAHRERRETVWTKSQLTMPPISVRMKKTLTWMAANLREKDLLVIGFWTDWLYLNSVFADALSEVAAPISITVIDPASPDELQGKAPDLWAVAHRPGVRFNHICESASDSLNELRKQFSRAFLRKLLHAGKTALEEETSSPCDPAWLEPPSFDNEELYQLRRDAEGVPFDRPATRKEPSAPEALGLFHLLLRRAGAQLTMDGYKSGDCTVRVINGAGALLSSKRQEFKQPPAVKAADVVVCVGATDFGLPDDIARSGRPEDIVRNESGAKWVDAKAARQLLEI